MTTTKATRRNIALSIDGVTIVRPAAHRPGCCAAASRDREDGRSVTLRWTDEAVTDLTVDLPRSGCIDDCEVCGGLSAVRYYTPTGYVSRDGECMAWACDRCLGIIAVRRLAS